MMETKHILLVDDEDEIVSFMENFLKRFKIPSVKCTSGETAIQLYDKDKTDLVFLDIRLLGMDGFTVLKKIREIDPEARVIIIAGSTDKDHMEKAKNLGALDYITKPIDLGDLKEKIDHYYLKPAKQL